ncbi:MAG: hypothetical protein AAF500_20695 [Myxococcota bacterium]
MLSRGVFLIFVCTVALGCDEANPFVFESVIVDADDGNPAAGTDATTLRIEVQEGEATPRSEDFPINDGAFDAILEFESFVSPTRIRIAILGDATDLVTAPPEFVPSISGGLMRVVTTEPASCVRIGFDQMEAARERFAMVRSGTFALLAGGTEASSEQVEFFDALQWEARLFAEDFSLSTLGPTRAASIDEVQILVLPDDASAFVFNMSDPLNRVTPVVLHPGAGPASAIISVPGVGAMVIGGEIGGEAQPNVSVVNPDGGITARTLSTPRAGPAAAVLGSDVLIVGGNDVGDAEIIRDGSATGQPVGSLADGIRDDGLLVTDGESRALLMGGADEQGVVRQDTVRLDGCTSDCEAVAGPEWVSARLEALQPVDSALVVGGTDSQSVEEVQWSGAAVAIVSLVNLVVPRANPAGIVYESGAFVVAGGSDGVNSRNDFEFCIPSALTPL